LRINFPSILLGFQILTDVPKDAQVSSTLVNGQVIVLVAPITLKPGDLVMALPDVRRVELIERGGFIIWSASWLN
jgi:hypothetical protein